MLVTDVNLTGTAHAQLYDTHVSAQAENKVLENEVNDLRYIYWNHGTSARIPTAKEPSKHHMVSESWSLREFHHQRWIGNRQI